MAYIAAEKAKAAAEASYFAIAKLKAYRDALAAAGVTIPAAYTSNLATAETKAAEAQTAANSSITNYSSLASAAGITGTTIAASTGTTGTAGPTGTGL
ncbi:MAG: hypothetical protein FJY60_02855 [Betaproteobacteria bacterium]|nr:hypothetical protein [Betaproteobacteria bacterium]